MRPKSIIRFERLYLASLVLVIVQQAAGYLLAREMLSSLPGSEELGPGMSGVFGGIMIGSMVFAFLLAFGVPLLLWWLAARKRTEVAKWLLLVISVISSLFWIFSLVMLVVMPAAMSLPGTSATMQAMQVAIDGLGEILGIAAIWYLFRADATDWFRSSVPRASGDVFR